MKSFLEKIANDPQYLQAMIWGFEGEARRIEEKINEIRRLMSRRKQSVRADVQPPPRKKHRISAEGRARIAAAQRRRWAAANAAKKTARGTTPAIPGGARRNK